MDQRGTVEAGSRDDVVGPGKDESRLMVVDAGDVERYDGEIGMFVIDGDTPYIPQFADEIPGKTRILLLNCLLAGRGDEPYPGKERCNAGIVVGPCLEPHRASQWDG